MKQITQGLPALAAVCDKHGPDASRMESYLQSQGLSAQWVAPRDLDDVDRDIAAGRLQGAIFMRWQDLLEGIWNGEVAFARWQKMRAELRFVESPGEDDTAHLGTVSQAWALHKQARRRRQAISGVILSLIAIVSAFVLIQP